MPYGDHFQQYGSVYEEHAANTYNIALGAKRELTDGRIFRWCKNGSSAITAGKLCVRQNVVADHRNLSVASAASAGDKKITVTLGGTAATANQYAQGHAFIIDVDGEGIVMGIDSHPAASSGASLELTLTDGLPEALTTNTQVTLMTNRYSGLQVSNTDQADEPVCVTPIDVTASYYFWGQTSGPALVLADEALDPGDAVTIGSGTAGAIEEIDAHREPQVGIVADTTADTDYTPMVLQLE